MFRCKKIMSIILSISAITAVCSTSALAADSVNIAVRNNIEKTNPSTANELALDMGCGWNLGNTMEAVSTELNNDASVYDYEQSWGQPITTKSMIDGLKARGIKSVRIPVAWSNMISDDGNYTISESYLKRVGEIINYSIENGMYAIINIHWDGGWWEDFGSTDENKRNEAMKKYKAMWTQISSYYADYSDKLIFESANEELGSKFLTGLTEDESYKKCTEINQAFVDIIRNSSGNNKERFLLIAGYDTDIKRTCDERYVMPEDTIKDHLMISVHYYTPSTYCIANNEENSWGYMDNWGTKQDINELRSNFKFMKKFSDKGYGVVIGEYGVTKKQVGDSWVAKEGTDKYFNEVVKAAREYGFCPMIWDTGDWYDKTKCDFRSEKVSNIFLENS